MERKAKEERIVQILNGGRTTTLYFNENTIELFNRAVKNCINHPRKYPSIDYSDQKDDIVFTAEYLKNSLIIYPKRSHRSSN
ncbi:hypothetical protein BBD31_01620 [Elizabethkingia anophelis]|uniref:hypothetical protein n=1 Tax=Elizabethkingia anophelis TaxID=1117645 RepID=UPI0009953DCA|nr:hypothetical protein [Elizabethkingia anophelis]AQW96673.1 hypothetical protein BBD31_01620 [Elizabethkingia anophelis]MDV3673668.1 hypothetical protein [Elizabethkingia anophelis]MDV3692392.1 hypothetical protein [Elizabethkingia anophelis]OPB50077.1 hypothetical protein BAY04_06880 [Elizabethkingia anophelis]SPW16804.1 Uncharacterised protein [Elizabethkingia anophelis]